MFAVISTRYDAQYLQRIMNKIRIWSFWQEVYLQYTWDQHLCQFGNVPLRNFKHNCLQEFDFWQYRSLGPLIESNLCEAKHYNSKTFSCSQLEGIASDNYPHHNEDLRAYVNSFLFYQTRQLFRDRVLLTYKADFCRLTGGYQSMIYDHSKSILPLDTC